MVHNHSPSQRIIDQCDYDQPGRQSAPKIKRQSIPQSKLTEMVGLWSVWRPPLPGNAARSSGLVVMVTCLLVLFSSHSNVPILPIAFRSLRTSFCLFTSSSDRNITRGILIRSRSLTLRHFRVRQVALSFPWKSNQVVTQRWLQKPTRYRENLQQTHCHLFAYLDIPRLKPCVPCRKGERFTLVTFPAAHCQRFRQLHSVFKGGPAFNSGSLQFIYKSCFFLTQPILAPLTAKCRVYFEGNVILKKKENKKASNQRLSLSVSYKLQRECWGWSKLSSFPLAMLIFTGSRLSSK